MRWEIGGNFIIIADGVPKVGEWINAYVGELRSRLFSFISSATGKPMMMAAGVKSRNKN